MFALKDDADDLLLSIMNKETMNGLQNPVDCDADPEESYPSTCFVGDYENDEMPTETIFPEYVEDNFEKQEVTMQTEQKEAHCSWSKYVPNDLARPINPALHVSNSSLQCAGHPTAYAVPINSGGEDYEKGVTENKPQTTSANNKNADVIRCSGKVQCFTGQGSSIAGQTNTMWALMITLLRSTTT